MIVAERKIKDALDYYKGELEIITETTKETWEIESWKDYPSDASTFCGSDESAKRKSWFVVQNINYFGRIGDLMLLFNVLDMHCVLFQLLIL